MVVAPLAIGLQLLPFNATFGGEVRTKNQKNVW
jgi:hypothetical protein